MKSDDEKYQMLHNKGKKYLDDLVKTISEGDIIKIKKRPYTFSEDISDMNYYLSIVKKIKEFDSGYEFVLWGAGVNCLAFYVEGNKSAKDAKVIEKIDKDELVLVFNEIYEVFLKNLGFPTKTSPSSITLHRFDPNVFK